MSVSRDTPFGYACQGCGHCCHHYLVALNPYELERLETASGRAEEAFATRRAGMVVLRQDEVTGRCIFRSDAGCAVYADRPLACRLYPLRRSVSPDGVELWDIPAPNPDSLATYSGKTSIGDFIGDADTEQYLRMADKVSR